MFKMKEYPLIRVYEVLQPWKNDLRAHWFFLPYSLHCSYSRISLHYIYLFMYSVCFIWTNCAVFIHLCSLYALYVCTVFIDVFCVLCLYTCWWVWLCWVQVKLRHGDKIVRISLHLPIQDLSSALSLLSCLKFGLRQKADGVQWLFLYQKCAMVF